MRGKNAPVSRFANPCFSMHCRLLWSLCFLALAFLHARGDVTLPALISDNMVLQQKTKVNIWGSADPQEKVTVKLAGRSASAVAGADGKWAVKLDGLKTGGPFDMTIAGKNTIVIQNVAVGEVWVCAGASNMEGKVVSVENADKEIAAANVPMIRMFTVGKKEATEPKSEFR